MRRRPRRRGVFPGSFDPVTVAHLAIARSAIHQAGLVRVELCLSRVALAKEHVAGPTVDQRAAVLARVAAPRSWLGVRVTEAQLIADIAQGYDVVVMGADKWHQIHDVGFYESVAHRDAVLARLPEVLVVPRAGLEIPDHVRLDIDREHHEVSSTAVRDGRTEWMLPEAAASGHWEP